jgi:hypothetical protein
MQHKLTPMNSGKSQWKPSADPTNENLGMLSVGRANTNSNRQNDNATQEEKGTIDFSNGQRSKVKEWKHRTGWYYNS